MPGEASKTERILVISLAGIGDTLFTTPLIHELRQNRPDAIIEALVMWRGARDLLDNNPFLNATHQHKLIGAGPLETLRILMSIRRRGYDISFNTHPQSRVHYRIVSRIIGARMRLSHDYHGCRKREPGLINRWVDQDYSRHAVENNLALLPAAGMRVILPEHRYELFLTDAEKRWAADWLDQHRMAGRPLLGIHTGSGGTKNLALRRWPLAHYEELIRRLLGAFPDLAIVLMGGPEEKQDYAALLPKVDGSRVIHPETPGLRQAAALIGRCHAFLSVDTALMHVGAAVRVPGQVVIETPTWNKPVEPFGQSFTLVPNPAVGGRNLDYYRYDGRAIQGSAEELRRLMDAVSPEAVFDALAPHLGSPVSTTR
jgi:ADP-heptose:LPS heptosyltransferase